MDNQTYKLKVVHGEEVVFEIEIELPGEDPVTVIEMGTSPFRGSAKFCEIRIENMEFETGDSAEGEVKEPE